MKLTCPRCNKTYNYAIDQIMGCLVKCELCRRVFPWKEITPVNWRARRPDQGILDDDRALPIRNVKMNPRQ